METGELHTKAQGKMKSGLYIVFMIFSVSMQSQEPEYVMGTFRGNTLINAPTVEMTSPKSFDFTIRHRFGMIGLDSSAYQQFLGMDLPANIRFGFVMPVGERFNIGFGRTKHGKTIDLDLKISWLRQTESMKMPVSLVAYLGAAVNTERFPKVPDYAFFSDSTTAFEYAFAHRLSYVSQVILARKFSEKFSLQFQPSFIYKNLVPVGVDNYTVVLGVGGMLRTGTSSSLLFEYSWRMNNAPSHNAYPLSIAWEFGTVAHVFQIVISSSPELIEQDIHTKEGIDYLKGKFTLGFNIRRTTWLNNDN